MCLLCRERAKWLLLRAFRVEEDDELTDESQWLTQGAVLRC